MKTVRVILLALLPWLEIRPRAAETVLPLRTNDVIAFIGGANMVALAQSGQLETLLTLAHPHHKLRFRSLAWEGDTVFAQPREVNYPDLVTQLKQVGATVAFVQFGEMESLAGEAGRTAFIQAYDDLLWRFSKTVSRCVLLVPPRLERPASPAQTKPAERSKPALGFAESMRWLAKKHGAVAVDLAGTIGSTALTARDRSEGHRTGQDLATSAVQLVSQLGVSAVSPAISESSELLQTVVEKNRLWFNYARPSNWAFLAGDRTEQAFSRDYHDRNIRAFAQEMQQFLPLIAAAEKRIDELAAKATAEKESTR
jgi:hypothetical protein